MFQNQLKLIQYRKTTPFLLNTKMFIVPIQLLALNVRYVQEYNLQTHKMQTITHKFSPIVSFTD